jgi:hypothetical protein
VNHKRQILSTTAGLPGRWNDKTVVRFDGFVNDIFRGVRYATVEYWLKSATGQMIRRCGAWLLVDGGYLNWSCTVPPLKHTSSRKEQRWSKWAESMRKDVECTFGILKGRWRILKTGIRVQSLTAVDNIWYTCCALHNLLLHCDGLDLQWKKGIRSDYEGEMGWHETGMVDAHVPLVFARANCENDNIRQFDVSRSSPCIVQYGDSISSGVQEEADGTAPASNHNNIRRLTLQKFREELIDHFHALWQKNEVVWPSRTGVVAYA